VTGDTCPTDERIQHEINKKHIFYKKLKASVLKYVCIYVRLKGGDMY